MRRAGPRALAVLWLISTAAAAGEPQDPCRADAAGPPGARMFAKLDPAGIGWVDEAGFVRHRAKRFSTLDPDRDGFVGESEYLAIKAPEVRERAAAKFRGIDADSDGRWTQAEWDAGQAARFRRIDIDADGRLTRSEFLADRAKVCRQRAAGRPRG